MSTSLYAYSVKLEVISSVFGSGDRSLLEAIKKTSRARYKIHTWNFNAFAGRERGEPTVDEAINDIVDRHITMPEHAWQYGHALELICEHLGVELPNDEFAGLHTSIDDVFQNAGLGGAAARLLSMPRYPMPIPLIEDLPLISCLTLEEAKRDLEISSGPIVPDSNSDVLGENEKTYNRFKSWLKYMVEAQTDLIVIFY